MGRNNHTKDGKVMKYKQTKRKITRKNQCNGEVTLVENQQNWQTLSKIN